jgi:hypothetical protein
MQELSNDQKVFINIFGLLSNLSIIMYVIFIRKDKDKKKKQTFFQTIFFHPFVLLLDAIFAVFSAVKVFKLVS